jgi:hypothetical protein
LAGANMARAGGSKNRQEPIQFWEAIDPRKFGKAGSMSPSAVLQPHGRVSLQKAVVEGHRPARQSQRFRIREISNAMATQVFSYFIQNI